MSKNVFDISQELMSNAYPGRGIILGRTPDNKKNVIAYFIMGRSENSRNRCSWRRRTASAPRPTTPPK